MAGKAGSASAVVTADDPGGTPRIVTPHLRTIGGIKISQITEENSPFGMANEQNVPVGKQKYGPVQLGGDYDTTADTGPMDVFSETDDDPNGDTRTLDVSPDGINTIRCEGYFSDFELVFSNGKLTGYTVQFMQAGLAGWL